MSLISSSKILQFSFFVLALSFSFKAYSAACCGGGFAIPSVITGDEMAQLTTTYSYSKIDSDVFANGIWKKRATDENIQILKIEGSHVFNDRYQAGFSIPVQSREKAESQFSNSTGLGDAALILGYEFLPDWDYNPLRPHGISFLSLTLPTGRSIYEMSDVEGLDSRGRGFWALGLGTVLTKSWFNWDANASLELHKSFEKNIKNDQVSGTAKPGSGGTLSVGVGYNLKDLRVGAGILYSYEDAIHMDGTISSNGSIQRFASGIMNISYMLPNNWAGTLSYSDQLLFGHPINTSLSRTISVLFQKRWLR